MQTFPRTGIIQNAPLTADFPNNLRRIVQGYRECLDHGAELVLAPATALCGPEPLGLVNRQSFLRQTQAALHALSLELGEVPLILGAYTDVSDTDNDEEAADAPEAELVPYLLSNNEVSELGEDEVLELGNTRVLVDINNTYTETTEEADLLIHLRTDPWYAGAPTADEEEGIWEAGLMDTVVISVRHTGCTGGNIYAGGSAAYSPNGHTLARLPLFESCNKVLKLGASTRARALPTEAEQLCAAIECGIRDTVRHNGYNGVCINAAAPNADLLAALCCEAIGRSHVTLLSASDNEKPLPLPGVRSHKLDLAPLLQQAEALVPAAADALRARLTAAAYFSYAEAAGHMYLSTLNRRELLLGEFSLYGESCGHFAPLGNLYEMDLYMLKTHLREKYAELFGTLSEPQQPATDRILHELADRNISATELLEERVCPFSEDEVRRVQRKLIAAALKNTQCPTVLHADRLTERVSLPACHRMND